MKISIVTATYNAAAHLRHCFASLSAQEGCPLPVEHIIVDGGSTDGTLAIIGEYKDSVIRDPLSVIRVLSEKDDGLYDALNKGIGMATGDIIGILHADDFYAASNVLQQVAEVFQDPSVDACYGDLVYVGEERGTRNAERENLNKSQITDHGSPFHIKRYWKSGPYDPRKFYWGWMPPHPTFFVRKSVYEKYGLFNLELGTAADYELMLRFLVKHGIKCACIPEVLVCMRTGGMSNASFLNRLRANRNDRKAWQVCGLQPYLWTLLLKPLRKVLQWWVDPPVI